MEYSINEGIPGLMRISLTICNVSAYVQIRKLVVLVSLKLNTFGKALTRHRYIKM